MIGAIAGQQGFSPEGKTAGLAYGNNSTTTYSDVCNVTGSGVFLGAMFTSDTGSSAECTVIIDGVTKHANKGSINVGSLGFMGPIRFETSLRVQLRSEVSAKTVRSMVSYLLD